MQSNWVTRAPAAAELAKPTGHIAETGDIADMGPGIGQQQLDKPAVPHPPSRPPLPRNAMARAAQDAVTQGMPKAVAEVSLDGVAATDSLSLQQLRRIVEEVKQAEPPAYDFEYADLGPHAEEIDEWFNYQFWQWVRLNAAQKAFEWQWNLDSGGSPSGWDKPESEELRTRFVMAAISGVQSNDAALKAASIGKLTYLVLGRFGDTAVPSAMPGDCHAVASTPQLQAINAGVRCLASLDGLPVIWAALRSTFEPQWSTDGQQNNTQEGQDELMNLMTIMYISVQETLNDPDGMSLTYEKLLSLSPSLPNFMFTATSKLRWDEQGTMPQTHIFLLFWKSIMLVFGGSKELDQLKKAVSETGNENMDQETITASPLDYHLFRQEITSKYPAYVPPQPKLPLGNDNTSLLPPLSNQTGRNSGSNGILPAPPNSQNGGSSILHQPVHIATPAPSPPPSPGIGGKGGKKQNYQTNQNFPFMYPPLDASSNSAGGKGFSGVDEASFSRRWEGSDIPASILEAGELFSTRVRMTRATRQLWEERERFIKYERGWDEDEAFHDSDDDDDDDMPELELSELTLEEKEALAEFKAEDKRRKRSALPPPDQEVDFGPRPDDLSERDKQRLTAVEDFYRNALPHLQSLVIVLLRPILNNATAIVAQQPGQAPGGMGRDGGVQNPDSNTSEPSPEELDAARTREITTKAMTGILMLLLKWLRLSHVLKFEYLTQLLLDSNYIPLVLKLFAHQDIQEVVDSKMDRVENSFFQFCNLRAESREENAEKGRDGERDGGVAAPRQESAQSEAQGGDEEMAAAEQGEEEEEEEEEESEDEAAPPPIKKRRPPFVPTEVAAAAAAAVEDAARGEDDGVRRPEVDELGNPINPLPAKPITDFSRRNLFSLINYLRVMQKICKNKAHRNLLLVQYKSSTILRKSLKVPQEELRLYTLKLFKGQVPYCGRKWRQSNMRVITAVYLHCRPELRDEWLAGSDIDAEVDSALPLEQALRSLTHWLNLRRYPDEIAPEIRAAIREEQDFFTRELEKLDMSVAEYSGDDGMSEMEPGEGWS